MELPDSYKPGSLSANHNSRKEVIYAIGIEHKPNSFGMTHGPHSDIKEMLEVCPEPKSALIRFNLDGTEDVLYRWDETNETWVKNDLSLQPPSVQILNSEIVEKIRSRILMMPDSNLKEILGHLLDSHEELRRLITCYDIFLDGTKLSLRDIHLSQ
jgi:hypothetical protein